MSRGSVIGALSSFLALVCLVGCGRKAVAAPGSARSVAVTPAVSALETQLKTLAAAAEAWRLVHGSDVLTADDAAAGGQEQTNGQQAK